MIMERKVAPLPARDRSLNLRNKISYVAEMWGSMREWLKGGVIPPTPELIADLEGVEYGYVIKNGVDAIQLEKKQDMKKRGVASSDFGDALALTFAYPISADVPERRTRYRQMEVEYNPYRELDEDRGSSHTYGYNPYKETW
jgi:hypothetical protein